MTLNLELFEKDPCTHALLNQGVAKMTSGDSATELETLRYELENFVCDGQYANGLVNILSAYLRHLEKPEQPGVWVSGFFGSGKSHLVKMLQHLWIDFEFPDKAKARGVAKLPSAVTDLLKELTNIAKRAGGLHAAAGTLGAGAGDSLRLELLGIIFRSVGLPFQYRPGTFMVWLREKGWETAILTAIKNAGVDTESEIANFDLSDVIARTILSCQPDFANTPGDVKNLLSSTFPEKSDITTEELLLRIKQAIGKKGKLPCTLVVLDEVQQYIGSVGDRTKAVQDLQEQCCSRLGANFLLVATGQNALTGTPDLQKLQGRFPVTVELQDTDVEQVTREVVLKKKPSAEPGLKSLLDTHSGEIERQLSGTKIGFTSRDRTFLVKDYPILPARRRFWEKVLRAVDTSMTGAQLRSQLRIVHDAVRDTADQPVGTVVSAAFIYPHMLSRVLQSGVLLQEISETIARQRKEDDGELRYQLCALIFLIGRLPREGTADAGVRADANTLADLLVTDLTNSGEVRKKVPDLLEKLVTAGAVMKVEDEYRMQTREGAEWNQAYVEAKNKLLADAGKLGSERSQLLRSQCTELLKKFKLVQGASKEPRKIDLHFGDTTSSPGPEAIPVWVRDGWDVDEKTVQNDARAAGDTAALVYGFIPKKQDHELRSEIASYYAAVTTLQAKGTPSTDEGREAQKSMETRRDQAQRKRDLLVTDILNDASVYVAGGDQMGGTLLGQKVEDAARACLDRLYPLFHLADHPASQWDKVRTQSLKGDGDALAVVGHKGDPESHPVCKAVMDYVGSGKKGTDVRKQFGGAKYGWPQDAIDAALVVLFQSGALQAKASSEPVAKGKLDQKTIAASEFRVENITLSKAELIAVRGLFKKLDLNTQTGQEAVDANKFLARLTELAKAAGGEAPLPKLPDTSHLTDISHRIGNDQLKALHDQKDRIAQEIADWQKRRDLIAQRQPRWLQLRALLNYAADLPVTAEVRPEVAAIEQHRGLLTDPDPVPGMIDKLTNALRIALNEARADLQAAMDAGENALEALPGWGTITPDERYALRDKNRIRVLPDIAVGTTDEILQTLARTKLNQLRDITDALPGRFTATATDLAKMMEPKAQSVSLPGGTIKTETDLQAWFEEVKARVLPKLTEGPVII